MIRFFRKFRLQLINTGKTKRYVLYAIGEILLIVAGILIAFAINNWNDARKTRRFERKMLVDIRNGLRVNFSQLNMSISCNEAAIVSARAILKHLEEDQPYHDSLDFHFSQAIQWCVPTTSNSGYESLKSHGLSIITNDSIRAHLDIYNVKWLENLGTRQEDYFYGTASPILTNLFETVAMRTDMKPHDYEALKSSWTYKSILHTSIANRQDQNHWYRQWHGEFESLQAMIAEELKKFN